MFLKLLLGLLPLTLLCCPLPRAGAPVTATGAVSFSLHSEPSGAAVSVDGVHRGTTPLTVGLTPGTHRVLMTRAGYFPLEATLDVSGDASGIPFVGRLVASH
jgi:hypothetical protein